MPDIALDVRTGEPYVQRATDPVLPNVAQPGDFTAQYPQPLDPTEIITMCEEINVYQTIPVKRTMLNAETYREITSNQWVTGSNLIAFPDGACPEKFTHDGENTTVSHKNVGVYASLSVRDILHSMAVAGANWNGINTLVGGAPSSEGMPGGADAGTFQRQYIASVKEKEMRLGATLLLNGIDRLLVAGNATTRPLEFNGIEGVFTNVCSTEHSNDNSASGSFSAIAFDRWLAESCGKPTHLFGHPTAIQELLSAYFQLGFQGSQVINYADGNRLTPGFNFAGFVNTGVGRLTVVADNNFARNNAGGGNFVSKIYALRMTHNGEPLVYQSVQVPVSMTDLAPGCTAIAFEIWAAMALIIKGCCFHGAYDGVFTGRTSGVTQCTSIG